MTSSLFRSLGAAVLVASPVAAQATSRWHPLGRNATESASVDTTRLLESGGQWAAWIEVTYALPQRDTIAGKSVAYVRTLIKGGFDCGTQRFRVYRSYSYAKDGNVVSSFEPDELSEWQEPIPESRGETLLTSFCEFVKQTQLQRSVARDSVVSEPPRSTPSSLTHADRTAIEATCKPIGDALGPGQYNKCLAERIRELSDNPAPSFEAIGGRDRGAIETSCHPIGQTLGPGQYNRCLAKEISDLRSNPPPSFVGVSSRDRSAIEASCKPIGETLGPGQYNRCLATGISDLLSNPRPPGVHPSVRN